MISKNMKLDMMQAIKDAQDQFLMRTELFKVVASEDKAKFDAYVSAGFSQDQALALVIGRK